MQRLAPFVLFVLMLVLAGLPEAPPAHAAEPEAIDEPADTPKADTPKAGRAKAGRAKAGRAKGPAQGGPDDKAALWWNDPKIVETLSLTDEQRSKMTEFLAAYREKVPQDRRPEAFHETLVQGNWDDARTESDKIAALAELSVRMRGTLKINVLSQLSNEQRETLVDRYPRLVYKPWRRAMSEAPQP